MQNYQTQIGGGIGCLGMILLVGVLFIDPFLMVIAFPAILIGGALMWFGEKKGERKEKEDVEKQKDILEKF